MSFFRISHPIAVGVTDEPLYDVRANSLARLGICGSHEWCNRRCGQMVKRELIQPREVHIDPTDAHVHR